MDGQFQINKNKYLDFLNTWTAYMIKNQGWEKYEDLHIDEIDKAFCSKKNVVSFSLFIFNCLLEIIDNSKYDCILSLTLSYSKSHMNLQDLNLDYISKEIDSVTPPSIYFFPKNNEVYERTFEKVMKSKKLTDETSFMTFYHEERESNEYYRTIFVRSMKSK